MQLPINGIWNKISMTGVPVKLTALDLNNNLAVIGTADKNQYYCTFSSAWT
jgi:hypothetical protein